MTPTTDPVRTAGEGTEPSRTAYEARFADHGPRDFDQWDSLTPEVKAIWARVEAACRVLAVDAARWWPIATVPVGIEVLVRGGITVMGWQPYGRRVAIILDRSDLHREDNGELCATSPVEWTHLPAEPIERRSEA